MKNQPNSEAELPALSPAMRKRFKVDIQDLADSLVETESEFAELLNDWQTFPDTTPLPEQITAIKAKAKKVADLHSRCCKAYRWLLQNPKYTRVTKVNTIKVFDHGEVDFVVGCQIVAAALIIGAIILSAVSLVS